MPSLLVCATEPDPTPCPLVAWQVRIGSRFSVGSGTILLTPGAASGSEGAYTSRYARTYRAYCRKHLNFQSPSSSPYDQVMSEKLEQ